MMQQQTERSAVHEVGLCESIVEAVSEHAAGRPVARVRLRAGALLQVSEAAMEQAFSIVSEGTIAQGAAVEVRIVPAAVVCRSCGARQEAEEAPVVCRDCGSIDVDVTGGDDLLLESIELAEAASE